MIGSVMEERHKNKLLRLIKYLECYGPPLDYRLDDHDNPLNTLELEVTAQQKPSKIKA